VFRSGFIVLLLTVAVSVVCAAKKRAEPQSDSKFGAIENISVLPIVDARTGDKAGVSLEKLQRSVVNALKRKQYPVQAADSSGEAGEIAIEDVEAADPQYIKKLGPADARWVLIIFLDDVASKVTFGSTGNAKLSGFLFDKSSGELVWKGRGIGQAGQGGLMGMAMKGAMKGAALEAAVFNLIREIPKRPKNG
jgi:hypothetical protein